MHEIAEVVAIDVSRNPSFDREEILEDPLDALKICSSLITTTTTKTAFFRVEYITHIVLAHYSVKEFLLSDRIQRGPVARYGLQAAACHNALAMACLNYLDQFQETEPMEEMMSQEFKLAGYSANSWYRHARKAGDQTAEVDQLALRLFSKDNPAYFNWIRIHDPEFLPKLLGAPQILDTPSPLYYASLLGLEVLVTMLLANGADVNVYGGIEGNALRAAISNGHEGIVRILINAGANVGPDRKSEGALHDAVTRVNCTSSVVSMLLESGAPTSTVDARNMTPLHYCVERNNSTMAIQLINAHVPIDVRVHRNGYRVRTSARPDFHQPIPLTSEGIETGLTPLHLAALTGKVGMTKLLLEYGADPNALSDFHETPMHLAFGGKLSGPEYLDHWRMVSSRDFPCSKQRRRKTLIRASYDELIEVQNVLLEDSRTSPNMRDYLGESPLHHIPYGKPDVTNWVRRLVSHGADPTCCNLSKQTPLHFASRAGDHESVKILIDLSAKVGQEDGQGLNALHYAARAGSYETMVAILETEQAKMAGLVASKDRNGKNVLHHLFDESRAVSVETVHWLLSQGADSLAVDISENTPLASLIRKPRAHDSEIARLLLAITGTALYSNSKGQNLGHLYATKGRGGNHDILVLLHNHGVDFAKKDCEGKTILHTAATHGSLHRGLLDYVVNTIGLPVAEQDNHGRNALQYATERAMGRV